jgi:hypothetical protein
MSCNTLPNIVSEPFSCPQGEHGDQAEPRHAGDALQRPLRARLLCFCLTKRGVFETDESSLLSA